MCGFTSKQKITKVCIFVLLLLLLLLHISPRMTHLWWQALCFCLFCCCWLLIALSPDSFRHCCWGDSLVPASTSEPQGVPFLHLLCSPPFSFISSAPTSSCSAILSPKQIDWDDRCRRMFLYPGHTYCSSYLFFITHLVSFLPLVRLFELLLQEWLHFM